MPQHRFPAHEKADQWDRGRERERERERERTWDREKANTRKEGAMEESVHKRGTREEE